VSVRTAAVVAVLLAGCGPSDPYLRAREACGLADDEVVPIPMRYVGDEIPETCVTHLAEAVHVDWDRWDSEPGAVTSIDTVGDLLLAGLYTLVASEQGTFGDLVDETLSDEVIAAPLQQAADDWGLERDDPAGRFWFDWATHVVRDLVVEDLDRGAGHNYLDFITFDPDLDGCPSVTAPWFAAVFVHEVSHTSAPGHTDGSDLDHSGAYGAQTHWTAAWWRHSMDPAWEGCWSLYFAHGNTCVGNIEEYDGFAPCDYEATWFTCDGEPPESP
jgi:hypothetical protein